MTHQPTTSPESGIGPAEGSWHRIRPSGDDRRTSLLFWLAVFALGCMSMAGVTWGASAALAKKDVGNLLQAGLLLPKLNSSHGARKADAFRMSEPEPSELAHPKDRKTTAAIRLPTVVEHRGEDLDYPGMSFTTQEPPHTLAEIRGDAIRGVEWSSPPAMTESCDEPVIYIQPCTAQRGDSPMMRNWKTLSLYSLLSAATVVYVPQPVLAGEEARQNVPQDGLEKLSNALQALSTRIKSLEEKKSAGIDYDAITEGLKPEFRKLEANVLGELKKSVDGLNTEIASVKTKQMEHKAQLEGHKVVIDLLTDQVRGLQKRLLADGGSPSSPVDKTSLDEIRTRLNAIQDAVARIAPTEKRTSLSMPSANPANGRVILQNLYSDELLFTVNGAAYRLPPRSSKLVDNIPPGSVRYEVFSTRFGVLDNQVTTLSAGDTFTVTAALTR